MTNLGVTIGLSADGYVIFQMRQDGLVMRQEYDDAKAAEMLAHFTMVLAAARELHKLPHDNRKPGDTPP